MMFNCITNFFQVNQVLPDLLDLRDLLDSQAQLVQLDSQAH